MISAMDMNIMVDELHNWPGESNIADLPTRVKASYNDTGPDSEWQLGPEVIRKPRYQRPAFCQFIRGVPQEKTRPTLCTANLVTKSSLLPASLNLHFLVSEIIQYTNSFPKQNRAIVTTKPSVYYLNLDEQLAYIVAAADTDSLVKAGTLDGLAPYWSMCRWNTKGRLGKGAFKVLGITELPFLSHKSRMAELIMLDTHNPHAGPKGRKDHPVEEPHKSLDLKRSQPSQQSCQKLSSLPCQNSPSQHSEK